MNIFLYGATSFQEVMFVPGVEHVLVPSVQTALPQLSFLSPGQRAEAAVHEHVGAAWVEMVTSEFRRKLQVDVVFPSHPGPCH
jgi:hypothetical protein